MKTKDEINALVEEALKRTASPEAFSILAMLCKFSYYDESLGDFIIYRQEHYKHIIGSIAGYKRTDGYRQIKLQQKPYLTHRLVWLWFTGILLQPETNLDHIDQIRDNNKFENLRIVSNSENARNRRLSKVNTSGYTGVTYNKGRSFRNKWQSRVGPSDNRVYLGCFPTAKEAYQARKEYLDKHPELGYTENHGQ